MKKIYIGIFAVFALAVLGFLFIKSTKPKGVVESTQISEVPTTSPELGAAVKEFTVVGSNFSFSPGTISVNKGDMVKIIFKDDDGTHNLVIDGYNLSTNVINGGSSDLIQFVADKNGSFEFFCSVGSHRDLGMTGTLIVK